MNVIKIAKYFLVSNENFLNFKENRVEILWRINFFPLFACLINLLAYAITSNQNIDFKSRVFYLLIPPLICCLGFFLLYINKQNLALFNGLILLPIINSIIAIPIHMPFLITFPLGFGIAAFILYEKKVMVNIAYLVCVICMFTISYSELKENKSSTSIELFVFNFINFNVVFYLIFSFLRNLILEGKKIVEREQVLLAKQNILLEHQNSKILAQTNELSNKHQQLIEFTEFSNKITSIVTHDIKSPMLFIKQILSSYSRNIINSEKLLEIIPAIEKEIMYTYEVFDEMLVWSKEQSLQKDYTNAKVDLNEITEDICKAYSTIALSKKITLINKLNFEVPRIANAKYYKIILRNLISNAIKFTNIGGEIIINASVKNDMFCISVIDNGKGISAEDIKKIKNGESLHSRGTSSEFGTGYGLVFCVDLIQKSGGELIIESIENKGSNFSFTLPKFNND